MRFADQSILITGASQGIGRAFAKAFAAQGGAVTIADINGAAAETCAAEIRAAGGRALALTTDVASEDSTLAMAEACLQAFGRIDVLINNAAIFSTLTLKAFDDIPLADWDKMFAVNTRGTFLASRAVAPAMKAAKRGKIINMSSVVVDTGRAGYAHYVASKAAVVGLTRVLATELGPWNINVNAISPHGITTEVPRQTITEAQWEGVLASQAIRRRGGVDDMIGVALFLASGESDFISGQVIGLNAGAHYN